MECYVALVKGFFEVRGAAQKIMPLFRMSSSVVSLGQQRLVAFNSLGCGGQQGQGRSVVVRVISGFES